MSYSTSNKIRVITATTLLDAISETVICQNGATNITITLPNPATCEGTQKYITRYPGSTGTITLAGTSIQAQSGSLGATTTLAALGNNENWNLLLQAVKVGTTYSWLRIS